MRLPALALLLASSLLAAPLSAQTAAPAAAAPKLTLAPGAYLVSSRDSTRPLPPDITFVLHPDGSFEINIPAGEPILGNAAQKDGLLTWVEPRCPDAGNYFVRAFGKGFYLEAKEDACTERKGQLGFVLFTPAPKP
ncbi:MAG: hypothetical protein ABIS00_14300 [Gemmatimonadales bacterium]